MRNGLRFLRNWNSFAEGHNSEMVFYKMLTVKGLNNFETAEVIKSCIFS